MKSISQSVEDIVIHSDVPYFALQEGILNLSAYAQQIRKAVQNECKKPIKSSSAIVMALSRLQKKISKKKVAMPKILVNGVTIKHNLTELALEKTPAAMKFLEKLHSQTARHPEILMVIYGLNAINVIVQNMTAAEIKKLFAPYHPSAILPNLASITMLISEEDVMRPNIFYTLLSKFAAQEINVVEITTAKYEQTIILEERVLTKAYTALSSILEPQEQLY